MAGQAAGPVCAALHLRHIEALARRAALHQGAVRLLLEERLRALRATVAAGAVAPPHDPTAAATAMAAKVAAHPGTSPLAVLLAHIAQQGMTAGASATAPERTGKTVAPLRELKAVRDYRSTWSRLSVEARLHQALARVPANAGPLNTQRLVHQALTALRDASPAYLHRLVTQVEALLWLERVGQGGPGGHDGPAGPGPAGRKKPVAALARPTGSARSSTRSR